MLNKIKIYQNWINIFKENRKLNQFDSLPKISYDESKMIYKLSDFKNDNNLYYECLNKLEENKKLN